MSGIRDQENIDELRKRLYERGNSGEAITRRQLTNKPIEVSRGWDSMGSIAPASSESVGNDVIQNPEASASEVGQTEANNITTSDTMSAKPKKRRYRTFVLVVSLFFFFITASVSCLYLFFGANQISANNISISVNTEFSVAAGEVLPIQISITNQNSVAIDSAVLIINYPPGTRSAGENGKDLYEERIPIAKIDAGQAVNIPVQAILYGEENDSKEIKTSVEYRVTGSSGTFFKDADPQQVQISSSPLVLRVTGVEKISSGQEMELRLQLKSNAATVQKNILISASYPNSFTFLSAKPEAVYGENSWLVPELKPEATYEIVVRGLITGLSSEVSEIQLQAGNPQLENQFLMGSVLSKSKFAYTIENPFTNVEVIVNGDKDGEAVLAPNTEAKVEVLVTNTLNESIYDLRVDLKPEGNLIRDNNLIIEKGFYDSTSKSIKFEVAGDSTLSEIKPGETRQFIFGVKPDPNQSTASFNVSADIYARRLNEARAAEGLVGKALSEVKYSSTPTFARQLGYGDGPFTDTGAIPPIAEQPTTYTATLVASAGVNDMTGAVVTTSLPQYMSWTGMTEGDGQIEYNPVSKQIRWNVGDVSAKQSKTLRFQVSLLPSVTQVGRTAVVVGAQEMRATDRFTGVPLRARAEALENELSTELGFIRGNGEIQPKQ